MMTTDCAKCRLVPCLCGRGTKYNDPCPRCEGVGVERPRSTFIGPFWEKCWACQGTGVRYRSGVPTHKPKFRRDRHPTGVDELFIVCERCDRLWNLQLGIHEHLQAQMVIISQQECKAK